MLNLSDILFSPTIPFNIKQAVLDLMEAEHIHADVQVLTPTATNDDVNGSTHVRNGGTDFSYQDATEDDVLAAAGFGYYEYFGHDANGYTGHYYRGSAAKFEAVVVDPPAYAIAVRIP